MTYCYTKQQVDGGGAGNQQGNHQQVQHATIEEIDDPSENLESSSWYTYSNGREQWGSSTWNSERSASAVSCSFNADGENISLIQRNLNDG